MKIHFTRNLSTKGSLKEIKGKNLAISDRFLKPDLLVLNLGKGTSYEEIQRKMISFADLRLQKSQPDQIWYTVHEEVIAYGRQGKQWQVLNPGAIPIIKARRGGAVTYHGPGQLVLYPLLDLRSWNLRGIEFLSILEKAALRTLLDLRCPAEICEDSRGVFVKGKKICSIGIGIRRGFTHHGLAFNIDCDLENFKRIFPCADKTQSVTNLLDWIASINENVLITNFIEELNFLLTNHSKKF